MVTADLQSAELHVLNHCAVSPPRKEIDFFPSIPVWVTLVSVYFFAHYIHKHTLTPCHAVPIYPNDHLDQRFQGHYRHPKTLQNTQVDNSWTDKRNVTTDCIFFLVCRLFFQCDINTS